MPPRIRTAFSLLEVVIVVGILSILIIAIFVFLNPGEQFASARNARRGSDVEAIATAGTVLASKGKNIPGIDAKWRMIGTADAGCHQQCGDLGTSTASIKFREGTDDKVVISPDPDLSFGPRDAFSFALWLKPSRTNPTGSIMIGTRADGATNWAFVIHGNVTGFGIVDRSVVAEVLGTPSYNTYVYHKNDPLFADTEFDHVILTYDGLMQRDSAKMYINGHPTPLPFPLNEYITVDAPQVGSAGPLILGGSASVGDFFKSWMNNAFTGNIDDVRLYRGVLQASDAVPIMQGGEHTTPGVELVGHWRLDDGVGGLVEDVSDKQNHGSVIGGMIESVVPNPSLINPSYPPRLKYELPDKCLDVSDALASRLPKVPVSPAANGIEPDDARTYYAIRYVSGVRVRACLSEEQIVGTNANDEPIYEVPFIETGR